MKEEDSFSNGSLPDFNEMLRPKLELESDIEFTQEQRNTVYETMLKPLQVEISQILLYDSEAAEGLLKKYNALLHISSQQEFYSKYTELNLELDAYKKNDGNQKVLESKGQAIFQQIQDMQKDGKKLSLEDYETEFEKLKQTYDSSISQYSFEDRDKIEKALYNLYGNFMVRRVREGAIDEFEISGQDIPGLTIFLNGEINRLSQNTTPQVSNVLERIKYKLMSGKEAFADDEIWKLLSYVQNQNEAIRGANIQQNNSREEKTEELETTALAIAKEKKSIFRRIRDYFGTKPKETEKSVEPIEPTLPLKEEDIDKISLDWLAKFITKEQREEFERKRLDNKNLKLVYLPDSKLVVMDFIKSIHIIGDNECYNISFIDKVGDKTIIHFYGKYSGSKSDIDRIRYLDSETGKTVVSDGWYLSENDRKRITTVIQFACVLDNILKTNLRDTILNRISDYMNSNRNVLGYNENFDISQIGIINRLKNCYDRIEREYEKIKDNLNSYDKSNNTKFYNKNYLKKYKVDKIKYSQTGNNTIVRDGRKSSDEEQDDGR